MPDQLRVFREKIPQKPLCTNDFNAEGLYRKNKPQAVKRKWIQANAKQYKPYILLDVDDSQSKEYDYFLDNNYPIPNIQIINPISGNSHFVYELMNGVSFSSKSEIKPQLLYNDSRDCLIDLIDGADSGYTAQTVRNPLHPEAVVKIHRQEPFTLGELISNKSLVKSTIKIKESGEGRNKTTFDSLRFYAYRKFNNDFASSLNKWTNHLQETAEEINKANEPGLPYSEVKAIVKSVAGYTFRKSRTFEQYVKDTHTTELQQARRIKGLSVRQQKAQERKELVYNTLSMFPDSTYREIADMTNLSLRTINVYMKDYRKCSLPTIRIDGVTSSFGSSQQGNI